MEIDEVSSMSFIACKQDPGSHQLTSLRMVPSCRLLDHWLLCTLTQSAIPEERAPLLFLNRLSAAPSQNYVAPRGLGG
jgi:hypothetical protein